MSEPSITPGPWRVCSASGGKCSCGLVLAGDGRGPGVATVFAESCQFQDHGAEAPAPEVCHANARLIAAAPDLLSACETARHELLLAGYRGGIMDRIDAAIAKAKDVS